MSDKLKNGGDTLLLKTAEQKYHSTRTGIFLFCILKIGQAYLSDFLAKNTDTYLKKIRKKVI